MQQDKMKYMSAEERYAYKRHIENRRIEMSVVETAFMNGEQEGIQKGIKEGLEKGARQRSLEVAKEALKMNVPYEMIAQLTKLSLEEIQFLAQGKDIM